MLSMIGICMLRGIRKNRFRNLAWLRKTLVESQVSYLAFASDRVPVPQRLDERSGVSGWLRMVHLDKDFYCSLIWILLSRPILSSARGS